MTLADEVASRYAPAIVDSCARQSCRLGLESLNPRPTVIDADEYRELNNYKGPLCDYLIFCGGSKNIIAAVEMKRGRVHIREAVRQLGGGAQLAQTISEHYKDVSFLPLIVSQSISAIDFKVLQGSKISFRGRWWRVARARCGKSLSAALRKWESSNP